MVGALQDISSYRQLESQLRQAQRMESVGLLAGGVAHDFNNLLQVILANVDMGLRGRAEARDVLTNVQLAAQRAAQLTQQLLAFGRRQPFNARGIEVQDLLQDVMRLVPRLFGEQIRLHQSVAPGLPLVRADAGLLQQVLVNLFINARDAMRDGGSVTIRALQGAAPHEVLARQPKPSECIVIEVADTGSGMSPEVSRRIFEPFFTTKEHGHGTGLGLAVVFGIVEQHGGAIRVESELGVGTTFRVFLPIADGTTHSTSPPAPRPSKVPCGGERLLVVEDEALVRRVVVNLLSDVGYDVVQAVDGIEALRLFEADPGGFHGVLTDVVMPGMGGIELARKLRTLRSNLPIVFAPGYTTALAELENEIVLAKPYASSDLFETLGVALKRV
jgi:nitrogen-specific signal transduction histidine kinase